MPIETEMIAPGGTSGAKYTGRPLNAGTRQAATVTSRAGNEPRQASTMATSATRGTAISTAAPTLAPSAAQRLTPV
jgi:hypothetical protein